MKTMKKLFYFAAALALFACDRSDDFGQPVQGGVTSGADLPEVIYATVADDDSEGKTRTVVANDKSVLWNTGDAVSVYMDITHNLKYDYLGEDGVSYAELAIDRNAVSQEVFAVTNSFAVYPYSTTNACVKDGGVEKLQVNFPAVQNYAANSFGRGANVMVAAGTHTYDENFRFRNACGYLVIKLYGENITVKSIELTALGGEKIAGKGLITASNDAVPTVKMTDEGSSTITLNCGEGVALGADATEFWFAMPPVTFEEGFKILVTPTKGGAFAIQTSNQVEITRNEIQPMAALEYTPNAQAPNQLFYTRSDEGTDIIAFKVEQPFDANITAHYYDTRIGKFVIDCDAPITEIKEEAFYKAKINSVSFPDQLITIGKKAFASTYLQSLVIPGSVNLIDCYAFSYISALRSLSFLGSDESLEIRFRNNQFSDTEYGPFDQSSLTYIYLNRNINYTDENGGKRNYEKNFSQEGSYQGVFAIYGSTNHVLELKIGPKVTEILPMMFDSNPIVDLVIPGTVNTIGSDAFCDLSKLETVTFLPSPTNTPLTLAPSLVVDWGDYPTFYRADEIREVNVNREINYTLSDIDASEGIFAGKSKLTTVAIGEQTKTLSKYMFYNCDKLTSLTILPGVTTIDYGAFYDCDGLTEVTVPTSVTTMGDYVFCESSALSNVTLGAQTIGKGVLYNCDGLTDLTIKGTVNKIGNDPFYDCDNLSSVTFEPSPTNTALTLGYQTYGADDQGPFYDSPLSYINLDREINYACGDLDEWDEGVFANLHYADGGLTTEVTLGSSVETIWPFMFSGVRMTSVTIPASVTSVGKKAFLDCRVLTHVTCKSATPPTLGSDAFNSCDKLPSEECIAVPTGSLSDYQSKWSQYSSKLYEY